MKSILSVKRYFLFLIQILIIIPLAIQWIPSEHFSNNWTVQKYPIVQTAGSVTYQPSVLRVTALPNEPFFYLDENSEFHSGLEYQIVEAIAKKLNMTISYQIWYDELPEYDQLLLK